MMYRPSLTVFLATSLLLGHLRAAADEPAQVSGAVVAGTHTPSKREQERSLQLASTPFPIPAQSSFGEDLKLLTEVVAAKLQHLYPYPYPGGRVLNPEIDRVFQLVALWPCEVLREPLVNHYRSATVFVIPCAQALLAYSDPELRQVVSTRADYSRQVCGGCFCYVESVAALLKEDRTVPRAFSPVSTLLPERNQGEILPRRDWPRESTIPQAVAQLDDDHVSVRLQSWAWLAERGIIAPTHVVRESWSHLTEEQQGYVALLEPTLVGRERLLELYEQIDQTSSEAMRGLLLRRRAELGSASAKAEARRWSIGRCGRRTGRLC